MPSPWVALSLRCRSVARRGGGHEGLPRRLLTKGTRVTMWAQYPTPCLCGAAWGVSTHREPDVKEGPSGGGHLRRGRAGVGVSAWGGRWGWQRASEGRGRPATGPSHSSGVPTLLLPRGVPAGDDSVPTHFSRASSPGLTRWVRLHGHGRSARGPAFAFPPAPPPPLGETSRSPPAGPSAQSSISPRAPADTGAAGPTQRTQSVRVRTAEGDS